MSGAWRKLLSALVLGLMLARSRGRDRKQVRRSKPNLQGESLGRVRVGGSSRSASNGRFRGDWVIGFTAQPLRWDMSVQLRGAPEKKLRFRGVVRRKALQRTTAV